MKLSKLALPGLAAGLMACDASPPAGPEPEQVFTVLAQGFALTGGSDPQSLFEGIAVDETGESVYVGSFGLGTVVRLRASDLATLGMTVLPQFLEGLSVAPGGGSLLATHKDGGVSILAIPGLTPVAHHTQGGGLFVESVGQERALTSGGRPLVLLDPGSGLALAEFVAPGARSMWHFALSPDGSQVAALRNEQDGRELHLLTSALEPIDGFDLSAYSSLVGIAYHPSGTKTYIMARDGFFTDHLLVIDLVAETGRDFRLNPSDCTVFCVANPVSTSREGRWIVFAGETSAYFVDTTVDLRVAVMGGPYGSGVAASPTEDAFFFLRHDGLVTKVSYPRVDSDTP